MGSDSTVKARTRDKEAQEIGVTRSRGLHDVTALDSVFAYSSGRTSISVAHSHTDDADGDMVVNDENEHGLPKKSVEMEKETRARHVLPDARPVTYIDRELWRNDWNRDDRPCSLDDYVRQQRSAFYIFKNEGKSEPFVFSLLWLMGRPSNSRQRTSQLQAGPATEAQDDTRTTRKAGSWNRWRARGSGS